MSKLRFMFILALSLNLMSPANSALPNKVNGEFVSVSGKVTSVGPNSFQLKMNGDKILVEMDDYNWDNDGYKLVTGNDVVVTGRVDHDFLERKKIEAGVVYVKNLNSYFYANSSDEEDYVNSYPEISTVYTVIPNIPENATVDIQGIVTKVDGREFTLDTGLREITIDTSDLIYNPMDDTGYTQIDKYDRVKVSGQVEDSFFEGKEIAATYVTEL